MPNKNAEAAKEAVELAYAQLSDKDREEIDRQAKTLIDNMRYEIARTGAKVQFGRGMALELLYGLGRMCKSSPALVEALKG